MQTEILVVDTNLNTHGALVQSVREAYPGSGTADFYDPLLALKYGINNDVQLLVTSAEMRGVDGPQLASLLRRTHPRLYVVFVAAGPLPNEESGAAAPNAVVPAPATAAALRAAAQMWPMGAG